MRPITRTTLCALAAAAIAAPAVAASDYYLKLGDIKGESAAKSAAGKQIEIESWSWGATMTGAWDGTIKGPPGAEKFGAVSGAHRDDGVTSPRDSASGMPTGKRQHGWNSVSKPLDRGSVRVKVKFPWLDCRVGAAFPDAVLQNDAGRYELQNVIISGCAPNGVALNYQKVTVRGWDPATKKE